MVAAVDFDEGRVVAEAPGAPCVFKGCRGFLHPGAGAVGVVLCASWGLDAFVTRECWRRLADAVAAAGFPTLRFDYPGTGDSGGALAEITSRDLWTTSIGHAADFLRAYTGVRRFVFIGQSLGCALAVEAAAARSDVTGLLALSPVTRGDAYWREMEAQARGFRGRGRTKDAPAGVVAAIPPGFGLSPAMRQSLKAIDVIRSEAGSLRDVVVFDRADRQGGAELSEHFKRLGVPARREVVEARARPGDPGAGRALAAPAAEVVAALKAVEPAASPGNAARVPLVPATLRMQHFREEALLCAAGGSRTAMLCCPTEPRQGAAAAILVQAPGTPQVGWHRMAVDHARGLAAAGIASLRVDADDLADAVDGMAARGYARVALVGFGDGGDRVLALAAADPRIGEVAAVDPNRLGVRVSGAADEALGALRGRLATACAWFPSDLRGRLLHGSMVEQAVVLLNDLAARGTRLRLIYSAGAPGLTLFRAAFARRMPPASCAVTILDGADRDVAAAPAAVLLESLVAMLTMPSPQDEHEAVARRQRETVALYVPARAVA